MSLLSSNARCYLVSAVPACVRRDLHVRVHEECEAAHKAASQHQTDNPEHARQDCLCLCRGEAFAVAACEFYALLSEQ